MIASEHHEPSCPRCGYDLAGVVSTWSGSCPLEGRCSECGLGFFWGDVLNERLRSLPWLYEHARRAWDLRAWFATLWRALLPWSFWKRVQVHHRVRPWRVGLWVVLGPLAVIVAALAIYYPALEVASADWSAALKRPAAQFGMVQSDSAREEWLASARGFGPSFLLQSALSLGRGGWGPRPLAPWWPLLFPPMAFALFASATVAVCRSEWRGADVMPSHLARVGAYLLTPTVLLLCVLLIVLTGHLAESVQHGFRHGASVGARSAWPLHLRLASSMFGVDYKPVGAAILLWQAVALCCALARGLRLERWLAMAGLAALTGGLAAALAWSLGWFYAA